MYRHENTMQIQIHLISVSIFFPSSQQLKIKQYHLKMLTTQKQSRQSYITTRVDNQPQTPKPTWQFRTNHHSPDGILKDLIFRA